MARAKKQPKVSQTVQPPRLGVMSNLFGGTPDQVASILKSYHLEAVQLLPNFANQRLDEAEQVTSRVARKMSEPFKSAELTIAGVSAHTNFIDPDRRRCRKMIKRFDAFIEHCRDFGADYVITETGTLRPSHPWDDFPDNHKKEALDLFLKAIAPSVKLAQRTGVTILLEGSICHVVSNTKLALEVREQLGDSVGFVMDPANYFTKSMASASKKHLPEIFKTLGPHAPIAHAKDVRAVGGDLMTARAGTGNLDYCEFIELLDEYHPGCPLIFEQIRPEELRETIDFVDRFFD